MYIINNKYDNISDSFHVHFVRKVVSFEKKMSDVKIVQMIFFPY